MTTTAPVTSNCSCAACSVFGSGACSIPDLGDPEIRRSKRPQALDFMLWLEGEATEFCKERADDGRAQVSAFATSWLGHEVDDICGSLHDRLLLALESGRYEAVRCDECGGCGHVGRFRCDECDGSGSSSEPVTIDDDIHHDHAMAAE